LSPRNGPTLPLESGTIRAGTGHIVNGCAQARPITGQFPDRSDVTIGPLGYAGLLLYQGVPVDEVNWHGGYFYKSGAQLAPGISATVTIEGPASAYAAIVSDTGPDTGSRSVTYRSCNQPGSRGSAWVGGLVLFGRNTACVPLRVASSNESTTYRTVVALGVGTCPPA
jgi:hypothetical protein